VVIVRSAEAPRDLTNDEINAQLPLLARVLTAGYRRQAAMVEQGLEFAAARIQGLARGKHIRRVISSIWQQANEYALDIVQGEREARMKREKEQRAKEKEEALDREREEARRYRLRLVPRASLVTCRSMIVSLPMFLVAAAREARRFLVVETTVVPPAVLPHNPSPFTHWPNQSNEVNTSEDDRENEAGISSRGVGGLPGASGDEGCGHVRVLLRQGSAVELESPSNSRFLATQPPQSTTTTTTTATTTPAAFAAAEKNVRERTGTGNGGAREEAFQGPRTFLHAVGTSLSLSELRPCTTYRLALAIPPVIRNELLDSARSLGVTEAIRSLETPTESETKDNNGGSDDVSGGDSDVVAASTSGHLDVETLPDVPGEVPLLKCKVLTSASAVDPRDPSGALSLRRWQSPYPAIANMDGPVPEDFVVLAPGRPEPVVSLRWQGPENNGLDICSYTVERRIGRTGAWQKVRSRGGTGRHGDGGGEDGRQPLTFDEVDAPLRTISVDTLREVAVNGLALAYRVCAENVLGAGAPSKVVEVNLRAFLGHLRAQDGGGRALKASHELPAAAGHQQQEPSSSLDRPALPSLGCGDAFACTSSPAAGSANVSLVLDTDASSCSKPLGVLTEGREAPPLADQEDDESREKPDEGLRGKGMEHTGTRAAVTQHHAPHPTKEDRLPSCTCAPSPSSPAFGGNFMGLEGFGEARVHDLFAPPSLSSLRRNQRRLHAHAAVGVPREGRQLDCDGAGGGGGGGHGPYPLPPLVLASGISGKSHAPNATSANGRKDGGGDWDDQHEPVAARGAEDWRGYGGGGRDSGGTSTANNDVFHAFINLGRRLPGRLRRHGQEKQN
ncbi:unnamed protein product, partial [Ectocarpus sp. 12 AP-2014]